MKSFLKKLIDFNEKKISELEKRVKRILSFEEKFNKLSNEQLREKTTEFKERLEKGETLDHILEEAFAVVREASSRVLGMKHFPVQLMGGIVLHEGSIAEMKTGEGKTLVSTLPSYLNALTGEGVFVITVNEYLAARDREQMGQIFEFLGLSVGLILREMGLEDKKDAYACDIVYGTNSEFGFDYLRDNMAVIKSNVVQKKLNYAIIDEVDSILIDEARTPLIISGQGNLPSQYYITVEKIAKSLKRNKDYEIDLEKKLVDITDDGLDKVERFFGLKNIADIENTELLHHIRQSLHANYIMKKDQDYVVKDGEIIIVDKFTGRLMPGRRYNNGLHQAIEAKEGVEIQKESKTMATITYQNYFRMFHKIAGMTGTAYTEKEEIRNIYGIDVIVIPTNKPTVRMDKIDIVFRNKKAKLQAIVNEIEKRHSNGQPVLVGTIYIDESEKLSDMLKKRGITHKLLNAKQDKDEAQIISEAGKKGAVTIATNMAGRGTDIKLEDGAAELGGLFVIGTEKQESRRIDNQLRGRAGRQGDPGESQLFVSFEDSIFEKINAESMKKIHDVLDKLEINDEPIENKMILTFVEKTQRNLESINYTIRKSTLEFDEILNKQRDNIYRERNKILNGEDMSDFIKEIIKEVIDDVFTQLIPKDYYPEDWDLKVLQEYLDNRICFKERLNLKDIEPEEIVKLTREELYEDILNEAYKIYQERENALGTKKMRFVERLTLMKIIDRKWMEHLDILDQVRQGIGFQGIGQEMPIRVYNKEAFMLFSDMLREIKEETIKYIFSLATKEEMKKNIVEQKEITEEEKEEKRLQLEEKYKLNRKHLLKIPANLPQISFNIDINATEEIEVEVSLYYFESGIEFRLNQYDKKLTVKGVFPVVFTKPQDKYWEKGWYQVKIFVAGEEASNINFMVTESVDLEEFKKKNELQKSSQENIKFFSNKLPEIKYNFKLENYQKENIIMGLIYQNKIIANFEMPVQDYQAKVNIKKPENGWEKGLYHIILLIEDNKQLKVPFMIVDEFKKEEKEVEIAFNANVPEGQEVQMDGQLIHIGAKKAIANLPIKINKSGRYNIKVATQNDQWEAGAYEFRLITGNKIIPTKHFLIS